MTTTNAPTRLITPQDLAAAHDGAWALLAWWPAALLAAAALALVAAALVLRRARRADPRERAFRILCRRMGISPPRAARLRAGAAARGLGSPVALLVCPESTRGTDRVSATATALGGPLPGPSAATRGVVGSNAA